jgi:tetratricopeptide (TPR) repeat protein
MRIAGLLAAMLALALSTEASAQPKGGVTEEARQYFDAGAKAYTAGQYEPAVQAFQQAYAISPRPGILFSIGQAYRRQYFLDKKLTNLRLAIEHYRRYVEAEPDGSRIPDAAAALSELEPILARRGGAGDGVPLPATKERTRLMVTSSAPSAVVSIDGKAPRPLVGGQLIVEVTPGEHTVRVGADGFFGEERRPTVPENTLLPQDFPLREKPAKLLLSGESGSEVSVDGRFVGTLPLVRPIEVDPGRRFVTATLSGHRPYAKEIVLRRGEQRALALPVDMTGQRVFSYVLLVTGTAGLTTGIIFGGLALKHQNDASAILERGETEQLTAEDRLAYEEDRESRDELRRVAGLAGGAGLAVGVLGVALYLFDSPSVVVPAQSGARSDESPATSPAPDSPPDALDLSAVPVLSPDYAGADIRIRF